MPLRDFAPLGAPCWIERFSSDTAGAPDFYGELFGWAAVDAGAEYNHYVNFSRDGVPVAGGMGNDGSAGMPVDVVGVLAEPGTPNWFELHTRDYDASVTFYRQVFGWDTHVMSDDPGFRYTTFGEGDGALAGVMDATAFLPEGAPAGWSIYFGVDDTDAALDKIVEMGGSILLPPDDSPFGRLAQAADPTGASFKLISGGAQ